MQLIRHFPLRLFPQCFSQEGERKPDLSISQLLCCRGRIMDARVYEIGMQTRPSREKEKRIAFLFLRQNRYYSEGRKRVRGSARINVKKGAAPLFPLLSPSLAPLRGWTDGWTGRVNTARRNFQRVLLHLSSYMRSTADAELNNDSCYTAAIEQSYMFVLVSSLNGIDITIIHYF